MMNGQVKISKSAIFVMIKQYSFKGLLIFCILVFGVRSLQDACESKETLPMIDISNSQILKNTIFEYRIQSFETPTDFHGRLNGQVILSGNFSRLTLLNKALQKQYTYFGNTMILRLPSTHFYGNNKSADAELQIIYEIEGSHVQNRHKVVTVTQLIVKMSPEYLMTRYLSNDGLSLCKELHKSDQNGTLLKTSNLFQVVQNMPILMYQGSKNAYPCRKDVLCMVRKEFAQISEEDLSCLKQRMKVDTFKGMKRMKFPQKSLFEVAPLSEASDL